MQNHFPIWKNLLIISLLVFGVVYALPNIYSHDPAVQMSASNGKQFSPSQIKSFTTTLAKAKLPVKNSEIVGNKILLRFADADLQLQAADLLRLQHPNTIVALNLAPTTPDWLRALGATPMYLGLDLRGGVHFLLEVDMEAAIIQAQERYHNEIGSALRNANIRYKSINKKQANTIIKLKNRQDAERVLTILDDDFGGVSVSEIDDLTIVAAMSVSEKASIQKFALAQNMATLRNRVNEIGVAEPIVQQQGADRIVVQLPGIQDTTEAKSILGKTATLEYRLVDTTHDAQKALRGRPPIGSKIYYEKDGNPILLKRRVIVTGGQVVDASSGFDQNGSSAVFITLNGAGAKKMGDITSKNIGRPMAVVFVEHKSQIRVVDGKATRSKQKTERVISVATIRDSFSKRFQTTGLDSPKEARSLALMLRAGALAAPVNIIEERTVGPSLGQDNIEQGVLSVLVGFGLVLVFMTVYYKKFGLVANFALAFNLILIIAVLSMLQATLTLPGIAGIVLTVGMAVDANVLIFERIKEEIKIGNTPQSSIFTGYEKAFATILDANITTLLVALVLFGFGTGPVKGFAVTLSVGILVSLFTAIWGTRMLINWLHGARQIDKLSV